ncbi:MAG: hypothetical protein JWP95_508 [Actinotalea sp.]|nr:hypothetical protein [Actinotalea sp.]
MSRLLVTGGSGFVGGAVARTAVAAGWDVVTTSRRPAVVDGARHVGWDLRTGAPDRAAREAIGDVDVVVHAAAWVGERGPVDAVRRTTVDGTRAVLATFPGARLVHVSTASVYDPRVPSVLVREEQGPVARYLTPYAAAKAEAEGLVLGAGRPDVVVLRPRAVYGPGDTTLLPRVLAAVRGNRLVLPGGGDVRQSLTHVDTLVDAVLAAATWTGGPLVANVADGGTVVLRDALVELLRLRGHPGLRVLAVPTRVAWAVGAAGEAAARAGRADAPTLTRYAVSQTGMERTLDLTVLQERLGCAPPVTSFVGAETW